MVLTPSMQLQLCDHHLHPIARAASITLAIVGAMLVADLEIKEGSWLASQSVFFWPMRLFGPPALKLAS